MKKTILHIIDNLDRGGAETMLVTVTKQLSDYHNIIVTLHPENEFGSEVKCDELICLNLGSKISLPIAAFKLNRLIRKHKVDIVHSHLFWSTVVARIGTPRHIPLITTVHAFVTASMEYRPRKMRIVERLTYGLRKSTIIAVAKGALDEYFSFFNLRPYKAKALYTFVDTSIFNNESYPGQDAKQSFKVITVGNLKEQKNHHFLLDAFKDLKQDAVSLDIYGKGGLGPTLEKVIVQHGLNVTLKGSVNNIQHKLTQYDLFVMSSTYEGFALSVLEAMALGMPLLLSDIPSFKEQCADAAVYYTPGDKQDFTNKLHALRTDAQKRKSLGAAAKERVLQNFTLQKHMQQLRSIYHDATLAV